MAAVLLIKWSLLSDGRYCGWRGLKRKRKKLSPKWQQRKAKDQCRRKGKAESFDFRHLRLANRKRCHRKQRAHNGLSREAKRFVIPHRTSLLSNRLYRDRRVVPEIEEREEKENRKKKKKQKQKSLDTSNMVPILPCTKIPAFTPVMLCTTDERPCPQSFVVFWWFFFWLK